MKKFLFTIVAVLMAAPSFAQFSSGGFSIDEEHLYWGVRFGLNFSSIGGNVVESDKGRTGMTLGGVVGLRVTESTPVFLESGFYYTQRGAKTLKPHADLEATELEGHINYFDIPLLIKYGISTENNFAILPFFGPYVGFSLSKDSKYLKRSDMGFKLGCGLEWNNLYAEAFYQFGVVNIADKGSSHGKNLGINIGINF
ncbi:MAG: outer membrane beta-barrel protein [Prevotella sp.]|nr:outer membrane beta-barrel protein [Prevotella sp.]